MNVLKFETKQKAERLVCSACGIDAACDCGAPYVSPGARAEAAVKANPQKSDRAIAEEIGVSAPTVSKARKKAATVNDFTVEKRTGKDGKARAMPTPQPPKPAPPIKAVDVKGRVAGVDIKVDPVVWQEFNEKAQREQKSATALINELITSEVEPNTIARADLPKTSQDKLDIAIRQHQRRLDAEHALRMRGLGEEVRKRVVAEGKEYVASMKEMEAKAWEDQKHWRKMVNDHKPPLNADEFNLLRKCLHQNGIAATPKDFDAAFHLIQTKKLQLAGLK